MILVILDREEDFLYGITTYFQDKLGKSFDIYAFHTKEALMNFAKEKRKKIDVYLGSGSLEDSEKKEIQVEQVVCFRQGDEASEGDAIYKYQSAERIMKEFLRICRFCTGLSGTGFMEDTKIIGVYSPVGRCGKTSLALVMGQVLARSYKVIYVNLEEWPGFERIIGAYDGMDISDLIYFIKQERENLGMYINGMLLEVNQLKILPPVKMAPDIQELGTEVTKLLQEVAKSDAYDVILVDFGRQLKSMLPVIGDLEQIYMPVLKDGISQAKVEQFIRFLRSSVYAEEEKKIKQCKLRFSEQVECETVEELYYGGFGAYVAELLKEEGNWNIKTESEI